jgi:phosphatidylglycerol:prolipoprotein diacylglycerol transferase
MPFLNSLALGTAPGWAVARLGCVAVHDHPGRLTDFFLAVRFPDGARHDLGLDDFLVLSLLTVALHLLARLPRLEGRLAGVLAIGYAVPRFLLDFLRATDLPFTDGRILGLTPAQYVCAALIPVGIWLLLRHASSLHQE